MEWRSAIPGWRGPPAGGDTDDAFADVAQNGLSYFVVYPSQRAAQSKIRALADVLFRLAQED